MAAFGRPQRPSNQGQTTGNTGEQKKPETQRTHDEDADGTHFTNSQPAPTSVAKPAPAAETKPKAAFGRAPTTAPAARPAVTPTQSATPLKAGELTPALSRIIDLVAEKIGASKDEVREMKAAAAIDPEGAKACYSSMLPPKEEPYHRPADDAEKVHFDYSNDKASCVMSIPTSSPYAERFRGAVIKSSGHYDEETANDAIITISTPVAKKPKP